MALPTLNATFASAADLPRRYMLAQWLVNISYSGSVADYVTLPEQYLWAKIAVAAGASRGEADYISLPKNYIWKDIYDAVSGSSLGTIDWGEKQALGHIAAAYRGDTANPANLATYIDWPWRYQIASVITHTNIDSNAQAFITTSGATDKKRIDQFVKGVKNLGLWNSMVCWPLRSSQNAGTGTTAFSLGGLGTFNGTLRGGPSWGADGVVFDGSDDRITTPHSVSNSPKMTLWAVGSSAATTGALIAAVETFEVEGFYISIRKTAAGQYQYRTQITASGTAQNLLGTNTAISGFASVGCGVQGSSTVAVVNGISDGSGAYVPNRTGTGPVTIGGQVVTSTNSVTLSYNGTIAFAMSFVGSADGLSTSQQLALHTLYRATLGTGLGLP